jgi:hypothetical protein
MAITVTSPITGGAQTGLTAPSATVVADTAPSANGKQVVVTAMAGHASITVGSVSSPFTINFTRPVNLRILAPVNPVTGVLRSVPRNVYKQITRKGVVPLAGQATDVALITTEFSIPAGADLADPVNVRAGVSAHIGYANQQSANIGDTLVTGIL